MVSHEDIQNEASDEENLSTGGNLGRLQDGKWGHQVSRGPGRKGKLEATDKDGEN